VEKFKKKTTRGEEEIRSLGVKARKGKTVEKKGAHANWGKSHSVNK